MPSLTYCHEAHTDESNRSEIVILIAIVVESQSIEVESQSNHNCNSRFTERLSIENAQRTNANNKIILHGFYLTDKYNILPSTAWCCDSDIF